MNNKLIRNSTAEFLIFTSQSDGDSIEVRIEDENVWLSQKLISQLFKVVKSNISEHLKSIFDSKELLKEATVRKFRTVQIEGNRKVSRDLEHYSLEAIIALGYRINSERATDFRKWATRILKDFSIRGYVLDNERLKNGVLFNKKYFDILMI